MENWQACEHAWKAHLVKTGHAVTLLSAATGNAAKTKAPMTTLRSGKLVRSPDIVATASGSSIYWEVKYRSRPDFNFETGAYEYWMDEKVFMDYLRLQQESHVSIALFQDSLSGNPGYWLTATIHDIYANGRRQPKYTSDGSMMAAWCWPASVMAIASAVHPRIETDDSSVLPREGEVEYRVSDSELVEATRNDGLTDNADDVTRRSRLRELLRSESQVALAAQCISLGLPSSPSYSLTVFSNDSAVITQVLCLLEYGIRVFLISNVDLETIATSENYQGFLEARLLELSSISTQIGSTRLFIDGSFGDEVQGEVTRFLQEAGSSANFNYEQYQAIHVPSDSDVMVRAGAGTGKTETLAERLMFLLLTAPSKGQYVTSLASIGLVTFTREASAEIVARVTRTLTLRHRLCSKLVYPAGTWLMQVGRLKSGTIHSLSQNIMGDLATGVGMPTNLRPGQSTTSFRACIDQAIGETASKFDANMIHSRKFHEWVNHIDFLWDEIGKHSIDLTDAFQRENLLKPLKLFSQSADPGLFTQAVLIRLGELWGSHQKSTGEIGVNQLVPFALRLLKQITSNSSGFLTHLFVDEFQDTDAEQIALFSELRRLGVSLYVVGDEKQGVYRFRGAAGQAFTEISNRWADNGRLQFTTIFLTKNFRTGKLLLNSLERVFSNWNSLERLEFPPESRLKVGLPNLESWPAHFVQTEDWRRDIVDRVSRTKNKFPTDSIGLLFFTNAEALECQELLHSSGLNCTVRVGGTFFQTPAIRELGTFLQALSSYMDLSLVAQVAETQWLHALCAEEPPVELRAWIPSWGSSSRRIDILPWTGRFQRSQVDGSPRFVTSDLENLAIRLGMLASVLERRGTLAGLITIIQSVKPWLYGQADFVIHHSESARYESCLDQFLAIADETFSSAAVSIGSLAEWLNVKIATDSSTDEHIAEGVGIGSVTEALTVWKSKGLEYDHVIVPNTSYPLALSTSKRALDSTTALVKYGDSNTVDLLWRWADKGKVIWNNYSPLSDLAVWSRDDLASVKEQTRVLYVAFTRARKTLTVLLPNRISRPEAGLPENWAALIREAKVEIV